MSSTDTGYAADDFAGTVDAIDRATRRILATYPVHLVCALASVSNGGCCGPAARCKRVSFRGV